MKENKYDDKRFFDRYSAMRRSTEGLRGAGEWYALKEMLPDFRGKRVLDLGCGFGWHCVYAAECGAVSVTGIDISTNMIEGARARNASETVEYRCMAVEDFDYPPQAYDVVLSSLTFHYLESFDDVCMKIYRTLAPGGAFVFSVEHPVFTAFGNQEWHYGPDGSRLHWPVDRYFEEGSRKAVFLGETVTKYHRTLTSYTAALIRTGFGITGLCEPVPDPSMLDEMPGLRNELRRPMMLLVSAVKNNSVRLLPDGI